MTSSLKDIFQEHRTDKEKEKIKENMEKNLSTQELGEGSKFKQQGRKRRNGSIQELDERKDA